MCTNSNAKLTTERLQTIVGSLDPEYYASHTGTEMTKRIAISLPDALFKRVERLRRRRRVPRSTWIQEALGDYVRRVDDEAQVEAYFEGYRRIPDAEDEDFKAVERASVKSLRRLSDQA